MRIEFYREGEENLIFSANGVAEAFIVGSKFSAETTIGTFCYITDYEVTRIESFTNEAYGIHEENREVVKITVKEIKENND